MDHIKDCRAKMARWKKSVHLHAGNRIPHLKWALETEISKTFPSRSEIQRLKHDLADAYKEEEQFWRQRCHEQWLRACDRNTRYFHNFVKGQKIQKKDFDAKIRTRSGDVLRRF